MLRRGDIAVVGWADQPLVAHLVEQLSPLVTTSTAGVRDAPAAEVLGRVVALRRGARQAHWPAWSADVLRWWPAASRLIKRVPGLREVVRRARDPY